MYATWVWARLVAAAVAVGFAATTATAQSAPAASPGAGSETQAPNEPGAHAGHDMSQMVHDGHDMSSMTRDGSGTAWQPDSSPMYAFHAMKGGWTLMGHESLFIQFLHESGDRGADQL